jgi:stage III sporulation protein AF
MDIIKEFVITLVSTIVLITAVEIILPDNSMKKYSKFILGAMLISVILNPIVKFFTNGEETITKKILAYDSNNLYKEETNKKGKEIQLESFKGNLSKNINNMLQNEFEDYEFRNYVKCDVNLNNIDIDIKEVTVYVKEKKKGVIRKIKKIDKVDISDNKTEEKKSDSKYENIRTFLSKELKIEKEKIKVINDEG